MDTRINLPKTAFLFRENFARDWLVFGAHDLHDPECYGDVDYCAGTNPFVAMIALKKFRKLVTSTETALAVKMTSLLHTSKLAAKK